MLPIPFERAIPSAYKEVGGEALDALTSKADEHLKAWRNDLIELAYIYVPERTKSQYLGVLGNFLNADVRPANTDRQKREKITNAITRHKQAATWVFDVKLIVDTYAGGDSSLLFDISEAWWVIADGTEPSAYDWSALGYESEQGFDGIIVTGAGDEPIFPGNVFIDVDNSSLTTAEVEELKVELQPSVPAYFRVILGYVSGGSFVEYGRIE